MTETGAAPTTDLPKNLHKPPNLLPAAARLQSTHQGTKTVCHCELPGDFLKMRPSATTIRRPHSPVFHPAQPSSPSPGPPILTSLQSLLRPTVSSGTCPILPVVSPAALDLDPGKSNAKRPAPVHYQGLKLSEGDIFCQQLYEKAAALKRPLQAGSAGCCLGGLFSISGTPFSLVFGSRGSLCFRNPGRLGTGPCCLLVDELAAALLAPGQQPFM